MAFEACQKIAMPTCRNSYSPRPAGADGPRAPPEQRIRRFLDEKKILTVPAYLPHYRNLPLPAYLEPLAAFGVPDDLPASSG